MVLQNLTVGANITLEIVRGESGYEIPTTVATVLPDSILIRPFSYRGNVLDLASGLFRDMIYNLYAVDPDSGSRFVWRSVNIQATKRGGNDYYEIKVNRFGALGNVCERRRDVRIPIDLQGAIAVERAVYRDGVVIRDISNGGLAVVMPSDLDIIGETIAVEFKDTVRDHSFHNMVDCVCVRKVKWEKGYLYGCRFAKVDKKMLAYISLKRVEYQAKQSGKIETEEKE